MSEIVNLATRGGVIIDPGKVSIPQNLWVNAGNLTATEAKLAIDELTAAYIDALAATKTILLTPPPTCNNLELRFRTAGDNNDAPVCHLYGARGAEDYYQLIADLTITQGQQAHTGTTIYFVDTITPANEDTFFAAVEYNFADRIARYHLNTQGYSRFVLICSNLNTVVTVYMDYAEI